MRIRRTWCLPVVLLALLSSAVGSADFRQEEAVGPGVAHIKIVRSDGPLEVDALVLDLDAPGLKVESPHAGASVLDVETVSSQANRIDDSDRYATGGINGDYFFLSPKEYAGKPIGLQIHRGEIISSPWRQGRSCFAMLSDGRPAIDSPSMNAWATAQDGSTFPIEEINAPRGPNSLVLYTPAYGPSTLTPSGGIEVVLAGVNLPLEAGIDLHGHVEGIYGSGNALIPEDAVVLSAEGSPASSLKSLQVGQDLSITVQLSPPFNLAQEAVGGGPRLIRDGYISVEAQSEKFADRLAQARHPRSAVGFDDSHIFLLTIDGRQAGYSIGATLEETAQILQSLGAKQGMNLDGGGSTTLVAQGMTLNSPSDGVLRRVANAILSVCTLPKGPPETLSINTPVLHIATGSPFTFALAAKDRLGNPVRPGAITWVLNPPGLGTLSQEGEFVAGQAAGSGLVKAFSKESGVQVYAEVTVHDSFASVSLEPASALLLADEPLRLRFVARSEGGEDVLVDPYLVTWFIESGFGQIDAEGNFTSSFPGATQMAAYFHGLKAAATLYVGGSVAELEDFEDTSGWLPLSYPKEVPASFRKSGSHYHSGAYSGRLLYDFSTLGVTRAAYATCDLEIGSARAISVWVYGDGNGHWLRGVLKGNSGQDWIIDFARHVDWQDEWRQVSVSLPQTGLDFPLHLTRIYLAEPDPDKRDEGMIYLDDLRVLY